MPPTRTNSEGSQSELQAFRKGKSAKTYRPPIPYREMVVTVTAAATIIFTGYSRGGMRVPEQVILSILCGICFLLSVVPYRHDWMPWRDQLAKLVRFPLFWLGGLYIAYLVTQALNPSWVYIREGSKWWLQRTGYIHWLPSGMITPFAEYNPWRAIMWMGGAWLFVCALWITIEHRRTALALVWTSVSSATLMAFLGILADLSAAGKMLWIWERKRSDGVFGSFFYENHAAAFLFLNLGLCLGLALYSYVHAERHGKKSNPAFMLLLMAVVMWSGIFFSGARTATVASAALVGSFLIIGAITLFRTGNLDRSKAVVTSAIATVLAITLTAFLSLTDTEQLNRHIETAIRDIFHVAETRDEASIEDASVRFRLKMAQATLDMWEERKWVGFGIGSYRFYFPVHQRNYPEIHIHPATRSRWAKSQGRTLVWRVTFAHSDWLQSLAEVGIVGTGLLSACVLTWWAMLLRQLPRWRASTVIWFLTFTALFLHAAVELIFWSPSIFLAFATLPVLAFKTLR